MNTSFTGRTLTADFHTADGSCLAGMQPKVGTLRTVVTGAAVGLALDAEGAAVVLAATPGGVVVPLHGVTRVEGEPADRAALDAWWTAEAAAWLSRHGFAATPVDLASAVAAMRSARAGRGA